MAGRHASRVIGELSFEDVSRLSATAILCLPIGAIEQHGPHLPLNTDAVLAEEFTRAIVARWGNAFDLWQLPTLVFGLSREHGWAAGTISLSVQTMTTLVRDLAHEFARALPARNLAIVNCHGGNRGILEALAQELRVEAGLNICVIHPAKIAEGGLVEPIPDIHAGKNETAMMLALAPHLVQQDRIASLPFANAAGAIRDTIMDRGVTWPWTTDDARLAARGIIGDPREATAAFGHELVERVLVAAEDIFRRFLDRQG